jgi:hypothetical protein
MSLTTDTHDAPRKLDGDTIAALVAAVSAAKARGWTQDHLKRWFKARGVEVYKAAVEGHEVPAEVASALGAISVHGLPDYPHAPNPDDIAWHIEWLVAPARGAYDDALVEIAWMEFSTSLGRDIWLARLFGLDELQQAVEFAVSKNIEGLNIYIGAALRLPDAKRNKRASAEDFYVATAVPIDIDKNYDATRANMAAICDDGLVVTTGLTPERRSQHWTRLVEPCDSDLEFGHAFRGLVEHVGADMAVKDAARVMRLGGTVSYPNARKVGLGYCIELTTTKINDAAKPSSLDALKALAPGEGPFERRDYSARPQADGITRAGITQTGKVTDGRERFFATKLLPRVIRQFQAEYGSDPSADELFESAFAIFQEEADNTDERWTSADGQRELHARCANTIRRLRIGRMARIGLYSIDTGEGQVEAEAAQARFEETRYRPQVDDVGTADVTANGEAAAPLWNLRAWHASVYSGPAPEIRWLCDGTIPLGIPVLFASMGGLGKSFIAIDLGLAIAVEVVAGLSTRPILGGEVVQTGTAVILSAEDSKDSIHRRLEKIDPEGRRHQAPERLIIVPLPDAGGPKPLIASDGKALSMTPAFYALKAELMEIPDLKVIVIDPLQAFVMADVNSDPAAGQFMWSAFASLCAATGATLIIPHHMRKDGAASIKTADQAREAIRGSTALVDGARLAYALWKADAEDGREMCSRLDVDFAPERIAFGAVVKANDQANREVQTYVRQESGLLTDQTGKIVASRPSQAVSISQCQAIVEEIGKAFDAAMDGRGEGYAISSQSGERQAWKLVQRRTGCPAREAKDLAAAWVSNGILEMQTYNAKHHRNALRLVGRLG